MIYIAKPRSHKFSINREKFKELSPQFISELIDNQAIRLSASAKNFDGMSAGTRTAVMD